MKFIDWFAGIGGLAMCKDFECVHDQCGICNYTDEDCEYEDCDMWRVCQECVSNMVSGDNCTGEEEV